MNMRAICLLLCTSCFVSTARAQFTFRLVPSDVHRLPTAETAVFPGKCDSSGNVYFRIRSAGQSLFDIIEVAPDGSQKATFRTSSWEGLESSTIDDFAADDGKVYALVHTDEGKTVLVVRLSSDGRLESKTKLEAPVFNPSQLIVTTEGNFFVSGSLVGDKDGGTSGTTGRPFNAFFTSSGQLIRTVTLKEDAQPNRSARASGKMPGQVQDFSGMANEAIHWGVALAGADGNFYLMRAVTPAIVFVISPAGELIRTLTIAPPNKKAEPVALMLAPGRIAIEFSVPLSDLGDTIIRVADNQSGKTIVDYTLNPDLTAFVACYSMDSFTFVGHDKEMWPTVVRANTR